jgi:exopolysaccharide biosynthesis protein
MKKRFVFLLICLICPISKAQVVTNWQLRTDLNTNLPSSIKVFEDKTIPAWYVIADLKDSTNFVFRSVLSTAQGGVEGVTSMAATNKAFVGINGGYFGGSSSYSLVMQEGKVIVPNIKALTRSAVSYYPTRAAFGVNKDKKPDVAWVYDQNGVTYSYPSPSPNTQSVAQTVPTPTFPAGGSVWPIRDAIGGGPVLVQNGQLKLTYEAEVFFGSGVGDTNADPRSAIGYTADGKVILMVVDGRSSGRGVSLPELGQMMLGLGAVEAMNLDGGGSSAMVVGDKLINKPSDGVERKVATSILLMPKSQRDSGSSGKIIDTGDTCCYSETGTWFESANTPYWGTTKSRLNEGGTGGDEAKFVFKDIESGLYDVYAWWVPANNRAKNAPFTISANGVKQTVKMDQTDALSAGVWNLLGTFKLQKDDFVTLSDQATGSQTPAYVVADAIRLVKKNTVANENDALPERDDSLEIFPNPTNGDFNLRVNTTSVAALGTTPILRVFDILGREVFQQALSPAKSDSESTTFQRISFPKQANGIYLLEVRGYSYIRYKTIILHN